MQDEPAANQESLPFSPSHRELVDKLKELCDIKTDEELVLEALKLMGMAVETVEQGQKFGSINKEGTIFHSVTMPCFANIPVTQA